jgi:hypothetical protein
MADNKISHEHRQHANSGGSKLPTQGRSDSTEQAVRRKIAKIITIISMLALSGCGLNYTQTPYQDTMRADFNEHESRQQQAESDRFLIEQHKEYSRDIF